MITKVKSMFGRIGERGYFMRDIGRGIKDPKTYATETIRQMKNISTVGACPWASRYAMRWVTTFVLPDPAPASTSTGPSVVSTARRCSGFSLSRRGWGIGGAEG